MTDETTPENEPTEEEALESIDVEGLGITGNPDSVSLLKNLDIYNSHLKTVVLFAEGQKAGTLTGDIKTDVAKSLEKNEPNLAVSELSVNLLDQIYELLESDPEQVLNVLKVVTGIKDYVTDTKQFVIDSQAAEIKLSTGVTETPDETAEYAKLVCIAARSLMKAQLSIMKVLKKELPTEFPVKTAANGDWLPDITGLPKSRTGSSNVGRGAKRGRVKYEWKAKDTDEFVPLRDGILTGEIANKIISFRSYRVTNTELMNYFTPRGKIDQYSETPWEITFETGTLRGFLPSTS